MRIMCIHGAWSSPVSFNHLSSKIKGEWVPCSYSPSESLATIISRFNSECAEPCVVVGHSLGGVIALNLHDNQHVAGIVTMASPLAGLQVNYLTRFLSRSDLIGDVASDSHIMRRTKTRVYEKPVLHLISTRGFNPFVYEENDGVVPLKSQRDWSCGEVVDVAANHYEILQHPDSIAQVAGFVSRLHNAP